MRKKDIQARNALAGAMSNAAADMADKAYRDRMRAAASTVLSAQARGDTASDQEIRAIIRELPTRIRDKQYGAADSQMQRVEELVGARTESSKRGRTFRMRNWFQKKTKGKSTPEDRKFALRVLLRKYNDEAIAYDDMEKEIVRLKEDLLNTQKTSAFYERKANDILTKQRGQQLKMAALNTLNGQIRIMESFIHFEALDDLNQFIKTTGVSVDEVDRITAESLQQHEDIGDLTEEASDIIDTAYRTAVPKASNKMSADRQALEAELEQMHTVKQSVESITEKPLHIADEINHAEHEQ